MRGGALSDFLRQRRKRPDFISFDWPTQNVPNGRVPIGRLCFRSPESPIPTTFEEFAQQIASDQYATFAFYLDTCFILTQDVPQKVWDVLFRHKIVITHDVWRELENWRNTPTVNVCIHSRLLNAHKVGDPNIEFQSESTFPPDCANAVQYYSVLLGLRKRAFSIAEAYLREKLKRPPTENEIHQQVQKIVSDRGMAIATKGKQAFDSGSKNVLTDERIVSSAFVRSIAMGQESTILTYDDDLREQFFKMQYLLDTHYRSMLIAEAFAQQSLNFYCVSKDFKNNIMRAYDSLELWSRPRGLEYRVLPEHHNFVNVNLFRFGGSPGNLLVFPMCFSAEREMEKLLQVKVATQGANTDRLEGKNLHICPFPPPTNMTGQLIGISTDTSFMKLESFSISVIDAEMALRRFERSAQQRDVSIDEPGGIRSKEIDAAISFTNAPSSARLRLTLASNPLPIGDGMFPFVLKIYPPHAEVIVDRSITPSCLPDEFCEAINFRRGWWLSELPMTRQKGDMGKFVVDYYSAILAHKKLFAKVIEANLASKLGRLPAEDALLKEINLYDKGSGTYRAAQFVRGLSDPLIFEDDRVIARSMTHSVGTGADSIFITGSRSTFEQFCTLARLLFLNYRAWCLGQKFGDVDDPLSHLCDLVGKQVGTQFARNGDAVSSLDQMILPEGGLRVRVHCWLVEGIEKDRLSIFTAEASFERPFVHMLIAHDAYLEAIESGNTKCPVPTGLTVRNSLIKKLTPNDYDLNSTVKIGSTDFPHDERLDYCVSAVDRADLVYVHREGDLFQFPWR